MLQVGLQAQVLKNELQLYSSTSTQYYISVYYCIVYFQRSLLIAANTHNQSVNITESSKPTDEKRCRFSDVNLHTSCAIVFRQKLVSEQSCRILQNIRIRSRRRFLNPDLRVIEKLLGIYLVLYVVAHWCRQCKSLESEFNQVATSLHGSDIRLAKVDGTVETNLVERFQVRCRHLDVFNSTRCTVGNSLKTMTHRLTNIYALSLCPYRPKIVLLI